MLLHVFFLTCVCKSSLCYNSGDKFLAKTEFVLMCNTSVGFSGTFTLQCGEDSHTNEGRLPKRGVHCKLLWGMMCRSIEVGNILLGNGAIIIFFLISASLPYRMPVSWAEKYYRLGAWVLAELLRDLEPGSLPAAIFCIWAGNTLEDMFVSDELSVWEALPFCRPQLAKLAQGQQGMTISPLIL